MIFRRRKDGLLVPFYPIAGGAEADGNLANETISGPVTISGQPIQATISGQPIQTTSAVPVAANSLTGNQNIAATQAATTIITIPANRIWNGVIGASCSVEEDAAGAVAGRARCIFSIAGAGSTPAPGNIFAVEARAGANAATGTVGSQAANFGSVPIIIFGNAGGTTVVQVATSQSGTNSQVDAFAIGMLL